MRVEDIPAITGISDTVHGRLTEGPEVFAERRTLYPAGCFLLDRGKDAAGYLISHPWHCRVPVPLNDLIGAIPADADTYYLHDLALLPDTRGSGFGRQGVELALAQANSAGFATVSLVAVNGADRFWAAQGFAHVEDAAIASKLQSYGEGTFFMEREL